MTRFIQIILFSVLSYVSLSAAPLGLAVDIKQDGVRIRAESEIAETARRYATLAPKLIRSISADLPPGRLPELVEIRVVRDSRDLSRIAPAGRRVPDWAVGVAFGDKGIALVALTHQGQLQNGAKTLEHELAHLLLEAALGTRPPRWLTEGFALVHAKELNMGHTTSLAGIAWGSSPIPFEKLNSHFGSDHRTRVSRAYAQSGDFVDFLRYRGRYRDSGDNGDPNAFREALAHMAAGKSLFEAFKAAYDAPLYELWNEWLLDVKKRYLHIPGAIFGGLVWIIGAFILIVAYVRRRRIQRQTLRDWEEQETRAEQAARKLEGL